jgi:hypothetical protein
MTTAVVGSDTGKSYFEYLRFGLARSWWLSPVIEDRHPERLRADLDAMIELERGNTRCDPR